MYPVCYVTYVIIFWIVNWNDMIQLVDILTSKSNMNDKSIIVTVNKVL